jgi:hypothetical protein
VSPNDWEQVKRKGDAAVERWIDDNMKYKRCVVVLIGSDTASRRWVTYEIEKAWKEKRGLLGIYIHNLKCPRNGTCSKGANPFANWNVGNQSMANFVSCYDPSSYNAYGEISQNLSTWVNTAIYEAQQRR